MKKIRVAIVDDHMLVIKGFKTVLSKHNFIEVVGEATNGETTLDMIPTWNPSIILMDINLPNETGMEVAKRILKQYPEICIIFLTMHDDEQYIYKAIALGAKGFVVKNSETEELIDAITQVHKGNEYFSSVISKESVANIKEKIKSIGLDDNEGLTKREIQIIQAISEGLSNIQIAEKFQISDRTVNSHRTNILAKMRVKNSVELVVKALREKII